MVGVPTGIHCGYASVQASIGDHLITKPFDLFFEVQHAPLEIIDHWIIGCAMRQSSSNLLLEHLLPSFKIENMIWFRHEPYRIRACGLIKKEQPPSEH